MEEIPVLDHGFVRLDGLMVDVQALHTLEQDARENDYAGDSQILNVDLSVVNSARVSFGIRKYQLDEADKALIGYLGRNHHGTPFEHNAFRFHVKAPLFIFREWQRHRIGSFNELSGRYSEFKDPDFYIPAAENFRTQVGKPGAYTFERWTGNIKQAQSTMLRHCQDSFDLYQWYISAGMAKELARLVLPLNLYSEMYWTVNARSLMNFVSLRNSEHAMFEIREYAQIVEALWAQHMPISHEAFVSGGRIAP